MPATDRLVAVAELYGTSVDWILGVTRGDLAPLDPEIRLFLEAEDWGSYTPLEQEFVRDAIRYVRKHRFLRSQLGISASRSRRPTAWGCLTCRRSSSPMRGHLRKRGERSWAIVVDIGHDPETGKRLQKWVSVKGTKRDAERRLAEVLKAMADGTYVEPSSITVADYLDLWLRDYVAIAVRLNTADFYRGVALRLKDGLGRVRLADLKPLHVQRYYAGLLDRGLSAQTCRHHHRVLSQAIGQAVKWDMLSQNVMSRVTPPRVVKPKTRALDASEVRRLLDAADGTAYYLPIHLAVYTGLRRSEILGLRWSDVDLAARTLTVNRTMVSLTGDPAHIDEPKSRRSRRVVAFGRSTEAALRPRRGLPHLQVCARANGDELHPDGLTRQFKTVAAACGIHDVRLHDLRHTHASHLLMSGVPIHVVQARLGHSSIQTTVDTYGHVLPASDAEAGDVLDRQFA